MSGRSRFRPLRIEEHTCHRGRMWAIYCTRCAELREFVRPDPKLIGRKWLKRTRSAHRRGFGDLDVAQARTGAHLLYRL